jgi:uncharacterized protein (TIGR02001 family)
MNLTTPTALAPSTLTLTLTARLAIFPLLLLSLQCANAAPVADNAAATSHFTDHVTANVTLASQYISRGFRQTWGEPALQGGFDYAHPSGFFAGTWMSNVSSRYIENGTIEVDVYGGYASTVGPVGYSATVLYYDYPGAVFAATGTKYDYGELALGVTYKFLYAKYLYNYTRDYFGITNARGTGYLDLGSNINLGSGYGLQLHYGIGRASSNESFDNSIYNWKDVKVGVSKSFDGGWTLAGAYTKAFGATDIYDRFTIDDSHVSNPAAGTFVLSLAKVF